MEGWAHDSTWREGSREKQESVGFDLVGLNVV